MPHRNRTGIRLPMAVIPVTKDRIVALDSPMEEFTRYLTAKFSTGPIGIVRRDMLAYPEFYNKFVNIPLMVSGGRKKQARKIENAVRGNTPLPALFKLAMDSCRSIAEETQKTVFLQATGTFEQRRGRICKALKGKRKFAKELSGHRSKFLANKEIAAFQKEAFGAPVSIAAETDYLELLKQLDSLQTQYLRLQKEMKKREKLPFAQIYSKYLQTDEPAQISLALLVFPSKSAKINVFYANMPEYAGMKPDECTAECCGKSYKIIISQNSKELSGHDAPKGLPTLIVTGNGQAILNLKDEIIDELPRVLGISSGRMPVSIGPGGSYATPNTVPGAD